MYAVSRAIAPDPQAVQFVGLTCEAHRLAAFFMTCKEVHVQHRTQLLGTRHLAELTGMGESTVRLYMAQGRDGGLAAVGSQGEYLIHPDQAPLIVERLRAVKRSTDNPTRPRVA